LILDETTTWHGLGQTKYGLMKPNDAMLK
jgi:hypothetical protein